MLFHLLKMGGKSSKRLGIERKKTQELRVFSENSLGKQGKNTRIFLSTEQKVQTGRKGSYFTY